MPFPDVVVEKLKKLPAKPGCYIYHGEKGDVLYVGKALVLKNRVRSYFQASTRHSNRIERMVRKVRDIEWIVVDSEIEALVLECNLIKKHRPPYNVRLRDDKSYPYITITKENFPRVMFTRRARKDGSKHFGPYTSAYSVRETLQLLHRVFPLIPCGKSFSGRVEQRPCLYYHLGQCLAPCAGLADKAEYANVLKDVERFLSGKGDDVLISLRSQMEIASEALEFERAAKIRDQIGSIDNVLQRQKVMTTDSLDQDVIAVVKDERGAAIQMLYIRNGKLIGTQQFMLDGSKEAQPGEAVGEFVKQYYANAPDVPREVLLPVEIEERQIVEQWLSQKKGTAVTVAVPQGGEKLRLIEMAATNAEEALSTFSQELSKREEWAEKALVELQEALDLPNLPMRIEGYDISNIQGKSPVGSMVVTENGEPMKSEYRRFKIRYHPEDPNDFAMMHEVITRRLRAYIDGDAKFQKLPDLIMIDGGKGQLSAALAARDALKMTVPMVGLAKKMEILYIQDSPPASPLAPMGERGPGGEGSHRAIELPLQSPGLILLRRLRDEAHRFALTYHRKLRDKRFGGSTLEEVPGVGPRRKRLLLRTFGSVEGIRRASVEEIAAVPTMTRTIAETVAEHLKEE
ncbi:MAG: excinuclease ABC subunit UvrC [Fimbriimonadaceae bacterium]